MNHKQLYFDILLFFTTIETILLCKGTGATDYLKILIKRPSILLTFPECAAFFFVGTNLFTCTFYQDNHNIFNGGECSPCLPS